MSSRLPPQEPARPRRRADRPTAPAAARASLRATGRALGLLATEPRRRRAQRQARVALGRVVADHLAGQPAPPLLATPLAAHRAAQLRLASTDAPPRPAATGWRPGAGPSPGGGSGTGGGSGAEPLGGGAVAESQAPPAQTRVASRASRSAGRHRDLAAELERLLLIVIQFLPRLAAKVRLRMADERLGAWATGLSDPQDPVVAAARERAAEAQRATAAARAAASANWRQAGDAASLAARLVSEAAADVIGWSAHGIRSGWNMLVAWLVSVAVAARHRLRHGSAAAGRHVRAGSSATREGLRAGTTATREGLRAGTAATREGLKAGSAAAGRGVRGAGSGIVGAAGGLASRIDALADRGRPRPNGSGTAAPPVGLTGTRPAGPAAPPPGTAAPPAGGPGDLPSAVIQEANGGRNGHPDGTGGGRLVLDPGDPIEAWWLPSSMEERAEEPPRPATGRRARGRGRDRDGP
jgi:hypothetical protein